MNPLRCSRVDVGQLGSVEPAVGRAVADIGFEALLAICIFAKDADAGGAVVLCVGRLALMRGGDRQDARPVGGGVHLVPEGEGHGAAEGCSHVGHIEGQVAVGGSGIGFAALAAGKGGAAHHGCLHQALVILQIFVEGEVKHLSIGTDGRWRGLLGKVEGRVLSKILEAGSKDNPAHHQDKIYYFLHRSVFLIVGILYQYPVRFVYFGLW